MRKTVRGGVNLHEESESEQSSEPYGGDYSAPIDHSVGLGGAASQQTRIAAS
jgi:hypothetical protein